MLRSLQLYDQLLQFPLFQGMSHADLQYVLVHTKFDFRKYSASTTVYHDGSPCHHLYFLIQGSVTTFKSNHNRQLTVVEHHAAPYMLSPEHLFGINPTFSNTMQASTDANFILISKQEITQLTEQFLVFRINMFNILSLRLQRQQAKLWHPQSSELPRRIVRFFMDHCERPAGSKEFRVLMNHLAIELNDSRLDVSRALNAMQDKGLIELHRGRIVIPALEKLR